MDGEGRGRAFKLGRYMGELLQEMGGMRLVLVSSIDEHELHVGCKQGELLVHFLLVS